MDSEITPLMRAIERERSLPIRQVMADLCDRALTIPEMAADLKIDEFTVREWLKKFGARRRYEIPHVF